MIVFNNSTKETDTKDASWEALYLLAENWKKDLDFYLFDIKFLETLTAHNFSELLLCENLDELRELQIEVFELITQCEYLLKCIQNNLESITAIINKTYKHNPSEFRIKNKQLEDSILEFINNQREIRRIAFSMIKDLRESKKTEHILM
jgi:hypothetical protein